MYNHEIQFFTATILYWNHLLKQDKYKDIILSSMDFLVKNNRVKIFSFVILPNHIHIVWLIDEKVKKADLQRDFMKYTAQKMRHDMILNNDTMLEKFRVDAKDRMYQIWERNPLSVDLFDRKMIEQKINYIHNNPLQEKWNLAIEPTAYYYSSASFYELNKTDFPFLSDYRDFL